MLNRFKTVLMNAVGASELGTSELGIEYPVTDGDVDIDYANANAALEIETMPYSRPSFLGLTSEETQVSADHRVRPIIVPRDLSRLPWCAGYAECINAGKSKLNEDQASATRGDLKLHDSNITIPYVMFSMFDGHAGYQVALSARLHLHRIILDRLMTIPSTDLFNESDTAVVKGSDLVTGAIEIAYRLMDQSVEMQAQRGGGGCTAITILFLNGRLYAAGAGDSRTILVVGEGQKSLTRDHTPDSESHRVRALGSLRGGELLKGHFTQLEFMRRPIQQELGLMILYRDPHMTGWAYKSLARPDLRLPLISGRGKRSRVMGTIGVTRGFGDHGLKAANTGVSIKPFLSSQPEVTSLNLDDYDLTERDCVIMATDGLWDVITEKEAADILRKTLAPDTPSLEYRLTMGAQELVQAARGQLVGRAWRTKSENSEGVAKSTRPSIPSVDDISVLAVPIYPYLCEHKQWIKTTQQYTST